MSTLQSTAKGFRPATRHRRIGPALCLILLLVFLTILPALYPYITSAQEVTNVDSPTFDGSYTTGDEIDITITFSKPVNVNGKPSLVLETGTTDREASYSGPLDSDTLTFRYTVQEGDTSSDLDYKATNSLKLNGGSITDILGVDVNLTLATPGETGSLGANRELVIDTSAPAVNGVDSDKSNGIYDTDEVIDISVTFNEEVDVTGTPLLMLETGNIDRNASYVSGNGTRTLTFRYTVREGDSSTDLDYKATNSLMLNNGSIKDAAGNGAELTLPAPGATGSLGANKDLVINTNTRVTNVNSGKGNGTYSTGEVINITITFSDDVYVNTDTGTPYLKLETGTVDRNASYVSGSGTDTLTFRYIVQVGDTSSDLDYQATDSFKLNGGAIKDIAGSNADLVLAAPGEPGSLSHNKDLVIDTKTTVTDVNSDKGNGTYGTGEVIDITVTFSEEVDVDTDTGTPYLELETGTTDHNASYAGGSGTDTLTFRYIVQKGDNSSDLDYKATNSLKLNGSIIKDTAGNDADPVLATPGEPGSLGTNKTLVIDTTAPAVTSVTSINTNGTYKKDQVIDITIAFSEEVYLTGTPYLELETGTTDHNASYISGCETDTLTFRYTVQKGDSSSDLDYRATDSFKLNGGTIKDAAGNDADLMLASPGEMGSLGFNKMLVIDANPTANYEERFPGIDTESIYITTFGNQLPADIDAVARADTKVHFRDTGIVAGEVMIAKYKEEPAFPGIEFSDLESAGGTEMDGIKFIDVYVSGFNQGTATITIYYSGDEVSSFKEDSLSLFYWDGSAWQKVENISRYTDTNIILGEIPVSALSGTPIGLGGDEGQDRNQYLILFIALGIIGGIAVVGVLIWLFWDDRRKKQKAHWTSVKTPKNIGLPGR